jgi:hypothetical protein
MPANERDKEREKENGQRREREIQREKNFSRGKKSQNANRWAQKEKTLFSPPQILHSSLAALWYGAAAAPPVFIGSSLHLPIFLFSL